MSNTTTAPIAVPEHEIKRGMKIQYVWNCFCFRRNCKLIGLLLFSTESIEKDTHNTCNFII